MDLEVNGSVNSTDGSTEVSVDGIADVSVPVSVVA